MIKRIILPIFLLIVVALVATGCEQDGELRIRNRTAADIQISIDGSIPQNVAAWSNYSLFYEQPANVSISYAGHYVFPNSVNRSVLTNSVTVVSIEPDGGAITLVNDGGMVLTEMYISPSGEPTWGTDQIVQNLLPGQQSLWTVTPGVWDIRVVDNQYNTYYEFGQTVVTNETLTLLFSLFGKGD